jgi:hypothetical protein
VLNYLKIFICHFFKAIESQEDRLFSKKHFISFYLPRPDLHFSPFLRFSSRAKTTAVAPRHLCYMTVHYRLTALLSQILSRTGFEMPIACIVCNSVVYIWHDGSKDDFEPQRPAAGSVGAREARERPTEPDVGEPSKWGRVSTSDPDREFEARVGSFPVNPI